MQKEVGIDLVKVPKQPFFQELSIVLGQEHVSMRKTIGAPMQHTGG